MKRLLLLLLAMLLLLPCLAQAETVGEHVPDLAAQAEVTLEAMGLEPVETSLNPLTEWPRVIPADVMENELLPMLEGNHRKVVEVHYRPDIIRTEWYTLCISGAPSPSAARLLAEAFALAGKTQGELIGDDCTTRLYVSVTEPLPEEVSKEIAAGYMLNNPADYYDVLFEMYADESTALLNTKMGVDGFTTTVSGGNIILRTSDRLTDEMERDIMIRFLRTACTPDPDTGLRTLGVIGLPYSVLLNEETGRVEKITAEYEADDFSAVSFAPLASLLMDEDLVRISTAKFAQNGGYERLCGHVRISVIPVSEGQEHRKLSAVWLNAQELVDGWMAEAVSVLEHMDVETAMVESDHWNMLTTLIPLAMTDERMQELQANANSKTDARTITRYYVQKGAGLYASTEEWVALERMYPALKDGNLWLLSRNLWYSPRGLYSDAEADSKEVSALANTQVMYPAVETDVIWAYRDGTNRERLETKLVEALANCGYTEEYYREDRMLVDATAIVERPYQSVCRFWLREAQMEPCILMAFENREAAVEAHRGYAETPDACVALLWDCYLLVLPVELQLSLQCELMQKFLMAVQY